MRILVVEDEKRIADFLGRGLESAGYTVDTATDGAMAIEVTHSTDYDLVILDLGLPDIDGLKVLEKIRNRKTTPPVLILSARGAVDDRVKGLEQGADDYLVKPFARSPSPLSSCWPASGHCCAGGSRLPNACKPAICRWIASAGRSPGKTNPLSWLPRNSPSWST